jgi:hypothetical protein
MASEYEQNTQQSPCRGRSMVWQPGHSKKCVQAFAGISSRLWCPQAGQVSVATSGTTLLLVCAYFFFSASSRS